MDQKSTTGTDKRSWRERLGIGAAGAAGKDMPRIADEFSPPAAAQPKPAVKPAPMAPRAPARAAARPAEPEKLADKLKAQRDAQEKLAEQRVQAARQRAEIPGAPASSTANGGSRPKFTFAGEEPEATPNTSAGLPLPPKPRSMAAPASPPPAAAKPVVPPAMTPQRPVAPPPSLSPATMTPPRQPLGAEKPAFTQRPAAPPVQPQMARPPQQRFTPPPSAYPQATRPMPQQNYGSAVPPYRPVDPANRGGYAPSGYGAGLNGTANGYVPPAAPQTYGAGPRLNVPPLALPPMAMMSIRRMVAPVICVRQPVRAPRATGTTTAQKATSSKTAASAARLPAITAMPIATWSRATTRTFRRHAGLGLPS
ncbi:MAG: hypothetical protein U1E15_07645 [Hyphomicrobiales bacterium]